MMYPKLIVRETNIKHPDEIHKYNLYIEKGWNNFLNLYTCMHCFQVFIVKTNHIDEMDTGKTIKGVPTKALMHWFTQLKNSKATPEGYEFFLFIMHELDNRGVKYEL